MDPGAQCDFLIVGAGVAGLRAALELAPHGDVLVVTKEAVSESNTHYAQGGIAVAEDKPSGIALHFEDTVNAGDGLVDRAAARVLVAEGPVRVAELIEWGAQFDAENGVLLRTREAAHSRPRILHAHGDATGAEISRSLAALARARTSIRFAEWTTVTGLVTDGDRVVGADLLDQANHSQRASARAVLIAAGGAGQVYSDTTNPAVATGDGIAIAMRAGAELADMEFYQFHPTAFSFPGAPRFLLSEALRGEGAWLRNDRGERFMERYHPQLELAPRDVVARAVAREGMGGQPEETHAVFLDMRHVKGVDLASRFPGISAFLFRYGLSLQRDLIPLRPAAHYLMGGIRTDLEGRTSLPGLYAAGEAACTGVHGANRLASNSLLEGLVFGTRAAMAILQDGPVLPTALDEPENITSPGTGNDTPAEEQIARLQQSMWAHAGLLRDHASLQSALETQKSCESEIQRLGRQRGQSRRLFEAGAISDVSRAILISALARMESRGAHFRGDYPRRDDERFRQHSILKKDGPVHFESRHESEPSLTHG